MKIYVEEIDQVVEIPDGLSDQQQVDLINNKLIKPTKFKDSNGSRLNKFNSTQDENDKKLRQQMIQETGIIENYEPNFYEKTIRPFLRKYDMEPSILKPRQLTSQFIKEPEDVSPADIFITSGLEAMTGMSLGKIPPEERDNYDPPVNILGLKVPPLRFAGSLAGGVGSLMLTRGALFKYTNLPSAVAKTTAFTAAKYSDKVARFIPGVIMTASTLGTQSFVTETLGQAQRGEFDIEKIGKEAIESAGLGVLLGGVGPGSRTLFGKMGQEMLTRASAITGAAAIGFGYAKYKGADTPDAILQSGIFAMFEAFGAMSMDYNMNKAAMENVTIPFAARYIRTVNPDVGVKGSETMAKVLMNEYAIDNFGSWENMLRGRYKEKVYIDVTGKEVARTKFQVLESIEYFNKQILKSIDKYVRTGKIAGPAKQPGQPGEVAVPGPVGTPAIPAPTEPAPTAPAKPPLVAIVEGNVERMARMNRGYTTIITVDASKLLQASGEKAWSEERLKTARERTQVNSYPQLFTDSKGKINIEDGTHRIAVNAERGQSIDIAIKPKDLKIFESLIAEKTKAEPTPIEKVPEKPVPIINRLNPVEEPLKPAVEIAKKFDSLLKFKNALLTEENKDALYPVLDRISQVANEEAKSKLGVDVNALSDLLKNGMSQKEAVMNYMKVDAVKANAIMEEMDNIYDIIYKDAFEQLYVRAQLEKTSAPAASTPITAAAPSIPGQMALEPEAQKILDIAVGSVAGLDSAAVIKTASALAKEGKSDVIRAGDIQKTIELGITPEGFIKKAISMFPSGKLFSVEDLQIAESLFSKEAVVKASKAFLDYEDWFKNYRSKHKNKMPTPAAREQKVKQLQDKYTRAPRKKIKVTGKERDVSQSGTEKKTKVQKKTYGSMLKESGKEWITKDGKPILYKVLLDGKEHDVIASSARFNNLQPVEFIELVKLARMFLEKAPRVSIEDVKDPGKRGFFSHPDRLTATGKPFIEIGLNPALFKRGMEFELAKTLAHEFGHLTDWVTGDTLRKNNLLGKLLMIKEFMKEVFGSSPTETEILKELKDLSFNYMRPFDYKEAMSISPRWVSYREELTEIYADFISGVFFSPGIVEKVAPKSLQLFFDNLDKNQKFKIAYIEIQKMLTGLPEEILKQRSNIMRESFIKAKELRRYYSELKNKNRKSIVHALYDLMVNLHGDIKRADDLLGSKGFLPREGSPMYVIDEDLFRDVGWWKAISNIQKKMLDPLAEVGIDELTVGEYVFLRRVVGNPKFKEQDLGGLFNAFDSPEKQKIIDFITSLVEQGFTDRQEIANPFGFAPDTAQRQLDFMKANLGEEKFKYLEQKAKVFYEEVWNIISDSFDAGTYPGKYKGMLYSNKDHYATFGVLNYLADNVPAGLKHQIGTMESIENPIKTTMLKMVALVRWNSHNRVGASIVQMIKEIAPNELKRHGRRPLRTKIKYDTILVFENGRPVWYEVPENYAKSYNHGSLTSQNLALVLDKVARTNDFFRHIYITYSVSFAVVTNPIRDFKSSYVTFKALGVQAPLWTLIKAYWKAGKAAELFTHGDLTAVTDKMITDKAMNKPFADFNFHPETDPLTRVLEEIEVLRKGGMVKKQEVKNKILKPIVVIMNTIKFVGAKNEVLAKIAGYEGLKEKITDDKQRAYITRNYIGTPNVWKGGEITGTTNKLFLFSNVQVQDIVRNYEMATNKDTKSGYWWGMLNAELVPTLIMWLAAAGLLGLWLKKYYDRIPEYDKMNYTCIVLGATKDDRTVYARIPHSEMGRLLSGILWKTLGIAEGMVDKNKKPRKNISQILDYTGGQMPGVSPIFDILGNWGAFLSGRNPYDPFYGENILSEAEHNAGLAAGGRKMVWWTIGNSGLSQYLVKTDERNDTWFENIVAYTPGLNKLIKISDRGLKEIMDSVNDLVARENAQDKLRRLGIFERNRPRLKKENFDVVFDEIANEYFVKKKEEPTYEEYNLLRGQFLAYDLKQANETFIVGLMFSPTVRARALILMDEIRPRISMEEYDELMDKLFEYKIISQEVMTEIDMIEAGRQVEKPNKKPNVAVESINP